MKTPRLTRTQIIRECARIEDNASNQKSKTDSIKRAQEWDRIVHGAQRLSNDSCEIRHHLNALRTRLKEIQIHASQITACHSA